jgi:hypothetical protein
MMTQQTKTSSNKTGGLFTLLVMCNIFYCATSVAQEQVLPLRYDRSLFNHTAPASVRDAVPLPFFDDFSYISHDPDPNLWQNRGAVVNTTFPVDPISYGVATLDGLNSNGIPYDTLSFSFNIIGPADTLVSQPILLGAYDASSQVFFSFFYQAGGLGDVPNSANYNLFNFNVGFGDSLVLEFKDNLGTWHHIWSHDGEDMQPFQQVSIPVTNIEFFHDDFQFRFRNYATLVGNYDQWHIDYVKLNTYPSGFDPVITDVAIQYYPTSILKNFQSMPWDQFQDFQKTEKAEHHILTIRNNFNVVKNTSYQFEATKEPGAIPVFTSTVLADNIDPQISTPLQLDSFSIPSFSDTVVTIATKYWISATGDNNTRNDTIIRNQVFSNYMAYDDGSAEATYRLLGSPAMLALGFHLNKMDTLQGIAIHFSNTDEDISQNVFSLLVWNNLEDSALFRDDFLKPEYGTSYNGFTFYRLSQPVVVKDSFFIGWQQTSLANDLKMDIGYDLNDDAHQHLSYNIFGTWNQSTFPGAVMMRPYLGGEIPFGVGVTEPGNDVNSFSIYPNPVSDVLYFKNEDNQSYLLEVLDYAARTVIASQNVASISVAALPAGFYFLKAVNSKTGKTAIQKFIKAE